MPTALYRVFKWKIKLPFWALNDHWHLVTLWYWDPKNAVTEMLVRSTEQEKTPN